MGNRAVITWSKDLDVATSKDLGIYLHWNGGRDSVEAFLEYCKLKGYRSPDTDCYGFARLCQVIGNFFGGSTSVGIEKCCKLDCDNWDNGVYICKNWDIVGRQYFDGSEQREYDLIDFLEDIDSKMPESERLGSDYIRAEQIPVKEIKVGDEVFVERFDGEIRVEKVIGIGEKGATVNGHNVEGIPYVGMYTRNGSNINDYLWNEFESKDKLIRVKSRA